MPPTSDNFESVPVKLIEWGGAQRWLVEDIDIDNLRDEVESVGGSVTAYRNHPSDVNVFHPLPEAMLKLQRGIKSSFDPAGIFNPGRMHPEL